MPKAIAQPLIESLRNSVVAREHDIDAFVPLDPLGFDDAVEKALQKISDVDVVTRWSGASWPGAPSDPMPTDPDWAGGSIYRDERDTDVDASARRGVDGDRRHRR